MVVEPFVKELIDSVEYQSLMKPPVTHGMRSGRVYLTPGADCGLHSTKANEELLVFLTGSGVAIIGQQEYESEVGVGKITYIPPQTPHNIKNTGTEPLVYIYCVAPTGQSEEVK